MPATAEPRQPTVAHYVAVSAATTVVPTPLVPEVALHAAEDAYAVWEITARVDDPEPPVPFWSFPWPGGQALARHLLDHRDLVAGRRVVDLAAGSGLVGIAAALAGAVRVTCIDIDPFAAAAQALNARENGVALDAVLADVLDDDPASLRADVLLAGDVCYERAFTSRVLGLLRRAQALGVEVLLGDPGRSYLPASGLVEVGSYQVPTTLALEDATTKRTTVWRLS